MIVSFYALSVTARDYTASIDGSSCPKVSDELSVVKVQKVHDVLSAKSSRCTVGSEL